MKIRIEKIEKKIRKKEILETISMISYTVILIICIFVIYEKQYEDRMVKKHEGVFTPSFSSSVILKI